MMNLEIYLRMKTKKRNRVSWNSYFMQIANVVAIRSTCDKASVGCVIVKDRRIVATGYNGAPSGMEHCIEVGCLIKDGHCIRSLHAEVNAILMCAEHGVSTRGAIVYTTMLPCWHCSLMLINAGIKKIYFANDYIDDRGDQKELFKKVKIELFKQIL